MARMGVPWSLVSLLIWRVASSPSILGICISNEDKRIGVPSCHLQRLLAIFGAINGQPDIFKNDLGYFPVVS